MKKLSLLFVISLAMAVAVPALAQSVVDEAKREEIRGIPDTWTFDLGGYWQVFDTRIRLTAENGETGTNIDTETDLGLPDKQTNLMVSGAYRFSDRHSLQLQYLGWNRAKTWTMEKEIVWDDVTYEVGARVKAELDGTVLAAIYKYDFYNNGPVVFGANGGIAAIKTSVKLSGEGTVSGGGTVTGEVSRDKSATIPIPVLGLHFEMALMKGLIWRGQGDFFALSAGGWDSNVNLVGTSLAYYFTRNIGIGAGWTRTTIRVKKTGDDVDAKLDARLGYSGATAYVSFAF